MLVKVQGAEQLAQQIYFEYDTESTPLGQGGMGTVYLGRCVSEVTGAYTPVAVKFIANNTEDMMKRAMQEASVQIAHPNLMRMWGFVPNMEWDAYTQTQIARYYVVMEYLEGVNLDSVLEGKVTTKTGENVPLAQGFLNKYKSDRIGATIDIMRDVLVGVAELHANEYVHRDIDPSNAMLTTMGTVKVIDFGISKCLKVGADGMMHKLTSYGTIMGKMDYAAPEVVMGYTDKHTYSTDVYSLGIMLYQLAMGELPFIGDSQFVRDAQVNTPVPAENIPHWGLAQIVEKATQKDQANRYQNAQEMLDDFDRLKNQCESPVPVKKGKKRNAQTIKTTTSKQYSQLSSNYSEEEAPFVVPAWLWATVPTIGVVLGVILGIFIL